MRKKTKRIPKRQVIWKTLVVLFLLLHLLHAERGVAEWLGKQGIVKRTAIHYAVKGWLSNWNLHWIMGG